MRYEAFADAERRSQRNGHRPNPRSERFRIEPLDAIEIANEPEFLAQDILPRSGLTVVIGEPGSAKTFFVLDVALRVPRGTLWGGKPVQPGAVAYVTAEGINGFRKRLVAARDHYSLPAGLPFYLITDAPDLGHRPGDAAILAGRILEQVGPVSMVVIDTLARSMGGADENTAVDMSILVDNCGLIARTLGCLVVLVHHVGKDASKGGRGSSVLKAAADVEITIEGSEGTRTATVTKSKDGELGITLTFTLERVDIGAGDRDVSSCIVKLSEGWTHGTKARAKRKVTGAAKIALDALVAAIDEAGEVMPASAHRPNKRGCSELIWRRYCEQVQITETNTPDAKRVAFKRAAEKLQSLELIGFWEGWVWIIE